jgi:hypothetical protein
MFRRNIVTRKGYDEWPWPAKLPLKSHWYRHLNHGPSQSISREVRGVQWVGDVAVCLTLGYIFVSVYQNWVNGNFKTRLRHTTNLPPAIIAQEFDFQNPDANRKVTRARLDEYRQEFASSRTEGKVIEDWIFKY